MVADVYGFLLIPDFFAKKDVMHELRIKNKLQF